MAQKQVVVSGALFGQSMENEFTRVTFRDDGTVFIEHKNNPYVSLEIDLDDSDDGGGFFVSINEDCETINKGGQIQICSK